MSSIDRMWFGWRERAHNVKHNDDDDNRFKCDSVSHTHFVPHTHTMMCGNGKQEVVGGCGSHIYRKLKWCLKLRMTLRREGMGWEPHLGKWAHWACRPAKIWDSGSFALLSWRHFWSLWWCPKKLGLSVAAWGGVLANREAMFSIDSLPFKSLWQTDGCLVFLRQEDTFYLLHLKAPFGLQKDCVLFFVVGRGASQRRSPLNSL